PEAREVYEEGIILPMAKLFRGGAPNDDIFRILARNVRMPDKVIGDLRAQIAANHLGIERLRQMLIDFNLETLVDLTEQIVDTTEAAMRSAIAEIPDGKYVQQVTLDEVDRRGNPLHIKVSLDVSGTDIHVDLTGTSDQIDLPINS